MQEAEKVKRAQALRALRDALNENMAEEIERAELFARMHRIKYNAMIKQGFTEAQSLELCKTL